MPGSKRWSNDKPWSYFNDNADEDLVDFPREEIKRAEALEPVRHIGLHKRGVFCLRGASCCWSQSRPSRWSPIHNVLFLQFELLATKQAEIYLKIYVSWYTVWIYIWKMIFAENVNFQLQTATAVFVIFPLIWVFQRLLSLLLLLLLLALVHGFDPTLWLVH